MPKITDKNNNVNAKEQESQLSLLEWAASVGNYKLINDLLQNYLERLLEDPINFKWAIYWAGQNNHGKALTELLTKDILEQLQNKSPKTFQDIEKQLNDWKKDNNITKAVKDIVTESLVTINELKYTAVLKQLSEQDQINQNDVDNLFEQARKLVTKEVVNKRSYNEYDSLLEYAASLNNTKTIKYVLKYHSNDLQPQILGNAIKCAATEGHNKALKLLLSDKNLLKEAKKEHSLNLRNAVCIVAIKGYDKTLKTLVSNDEVIKAIKSQSISNDLKDALTKKLMLNQDQADKIVKFSKKTFFQKMGTAITDIADGLKESGTQVMGIIKNKLSNKSEKKNTPEEKTVAPAEVTTNSDPTKSDAEIFKEMTEELKSQVNKKMPKGLKVAVGNNPQKKPKISLDPKTQKALQQMNETSDNTDEKDRTFTSVLTKQNIDKTPGRSPGNY
jgi:predicted DNA-binding protein (UPF0251 family)